LVICDETWRLKPEALNEGLIPAMRARPQPLLVMSSTAGDENSSVLRQWRERGLNVIEAGQPTAFAMLEWSMPPGADWHDPRWWAWPNPCLGSR
jgi:phage terminase large subunit-like protein